MNFKDKRGFTLIELLIVIAIISIMSGIVLASLNSARDKASNAAIMSNLSSIRSQAEIIYDTAGNYTAGFCTNPKILEAIIAAKNAAGIFTATTESYSVPGATGVATCHNNVTEWGIEVPLKSPSTAFHCVDSSGKSVSTSASTLGANDASCN